MICRKCPTPGCTFISSGKNRLGDKLWICTGCGQNINPFFDDAVCPVCGHDHNEEGTQCPVCRKSNKIADFIPVKE